MHVPLCTLREAPLCLLTWCPSAALGFLIALLLVMLKGTASGLTAVPQLFVHAHPRWLGAPLLLLLVQWTQSVRGGRSLGLGRL